MAEIRGSRPWYSSEVYVLSWQSSTLWDLPQHTEGGPRALAALCGIAMSYTQDVG